MPPVEFVSPEAIETRAAVLVDVREAGVYADVGHAPGAVSIPPDVYRDPTGFAPGMLPDPATVADALGAAGIDRTTPVIAYGADPADAARSERRRRPQSTDQRRRTAREQGVVPRPRRGRHRGRPVCPVCVLCGGLPV